MRMDNNGNSRLQNFSQKTSIIDTWYNTDYVSIIGRNILS